MIILSYRPNETPLTPITIILSFLPNSLNQNYFEAIIF